MRRTISPLKIFVPFVFAMMVLFNCLSATQLNGQSFTEEFSIWPEDLKINGTVIACTGQIIDEEVVDIFNESGGKEKGKFVFVWFDTGFGGLPFKNAMYHEKGATRFGDTAETPIEKDKIKSALADATGVCMFSSRLLIPETDKILDQIKVDLKRVIDNGGVVCSVGPVSRHLGTFRHESVHGMSMLATDLNLIPDSIVYGGYIDDKDRNFMLSGLAAEPHCVGIGIPANTAIVLKGRKIRTYGKKKATIALMANDRRPLRIKQLGEANGRQTSPYDSMIDLTAWRRDAIDRQLPAFPVATPPIPRVKNGTLYIVGGGGLPENMMANFVKDAGGEKAKLIYVPCSEQDEVKNDDRLIKQWKKLGVESATIFHTKNRDKANSDDEFLAPLVDATGIWFGGGRQWNFADSYYGTKAHKLMKEVLDRGGVIGGSSAGASIQGDYLARANPVANFDIMAPGYERGLGFLTGVAIDQHFSQRGRQKDMTQLVDRYPQLLGIGIDETTALVVKESTATIIGEGRVFFYDRRQPVIHGEDDFIAVGEGQPFNLELREIVQEDDETNESSEDGCN